MYFSECQKDVLTSNSYKTFYQAKPFYAADGVFELLIRFKGIADGHVILTNNATSEEPRYTVSVMVIYTINCNHKMQLKPRKYFVKLCA